MVFGFCCCDWGTLGREKEGKERRGKERVVDEEMEGKYYLGK